MAERPEDERCDVKLVFDDWRRIRQQPVFFLSPDSIRRAIQADINVEKIYRHGSAVSAPLGRDAIKRVLDYQPTFLAKIQDIKRVINRLKDVVGNPDVIAAAFGMPTLHERMKALSLTCADLALATGYSEAVVASAKDNYRVTLDFGIKAAMAVGIERPEDLSQVLTIANGDRRHVKNIGIPGKPQYVFDVNNLKAAPPCGHPWAWEE